MWNSVCQMFCKPLCLLTFIVVSKNTYMIRLHKVIQVLYVQVGDASYESFTAEKNGILSSLARRAQVSLSNHFKFNISPDYPQYT